MDAEEFSRHDSDRSAYDAEVDAADAAYVAETEIAGEQLSMDPVHPGLVRGDAAAAVAAELRATRSAAQRRADRSAVRPAHRRRTRLAERQPRATDFGHPAVLDHQVVAVEAEDSLTPVVLYRWVDGRPQAFPMRPLHAVVWARAGRVTLIGDDDTTHRLTLLAPDEHGEHRLGAHWPLGEPENRAKRVASATLRDLGDVLIFPVWLARTAHISAERNNVTKRFLRELATVSPDTVIQHNQTSGTPAAVPGQVPPYTHRGLLGHEGYPKEM